MLQYTHICIHTYVYIFTRTALRCSSGCNDRCCNAATRNTRRKRAHARTHAPLRPCGPYRVLAQQLDLRLDARARVPLVRELALRDLVGPTYSLTHSLAREWVGLGAFGACGRREPSLRWLRLGIIAVKRYG